MDSGLVISLALDGARNGLPFFETEYPDDSRPRSALEACERWLAEPTAANYLALEKLELGIWRRKDWTSERASLTAQACACGAAPGLVGDERHRVRAVRHGIET